MSKADNCPTCGAPPDHALQRGMPAAVDVEKFVLGALLNGQGGENVTSVLADDDFFLETHRVIYRGMQRAVKQGRATNRVSTAHALLDRGELEGIGGNTYLAELGDVPELVNLDSYVSILRDKSTLRRAITLHTAAIQECLLEGSPAA